MAYIFIFFILISFTSFIAITFNKKFEQSLFLSIFSIILIEFISGIFLNLSVGFYTIIILSITTFIISSYKVYKNKQLLRNNILTIGFYLFLVSYIIIALVTKSMMPYIWDDFSHWALVVKNMLYFNSFGFEDVSTVVAKTYLSGTSLFQYFCVKLNGSFNEGFLYFGMKLTIISMFLPIFKNFKSIKDKNVYITFLILVFLPVILFNEYYYESLYVDAILGICFANTLYSYFTIRDKKYDKFDLINVASSLCMLIFIKDFGIILAFIVSIYILVDNMFIKNHFSCNIKELFKKNKVILFCIIPCLIIKIIWVIKCNISIDNSVLNSTSSLFEGIFNIKGYRITVIKNFISAIFEKKLSDNFIPLTSFTILMISLVLEYVLIKNSKNKIEEKKSKNLALFLNIGFIVYFEFLLIAYLGMFSQVEAVGLYSLERYTGSFLLGILVLLIIVNIENFKLQKSKYYQVFLIITFLLVFLCQDCSYISNNIFLSYKTRENNIQYANYKPMEQKVKKYVHIGEKTYFICTNSNGGEFWNARYILAPFKINDTTKGWAGWSIGLPYLNDDIWTVYYTKDGWLELLLKEYDYVYLYSIDEQFINSFGTLFNVRNLKNDQLYKVNKNVKTLEFVE